MRKILLILLFPYVSYAQVQIGQDIDGEAQGDESGTGVSISSDGSIVAIGAPLNDGNGSNSGHVRVYENQSGEWIQIGQDIDGEATSDGSGRSISLSADGNIVAVGALGNDENGSASGHVRIYENQEGEWIQIGEDIDGEAPLDFFGRSVSLSSDGNVVAIGAIENTANGTSTGYARIHRNQDGEWVQIGQNIFGEAVDDSFGCGISLSSDGNIVAVGACNNDENGDFSGHVRVFRNEDDVWVQIGEDIDGEAAGDQSGRSISLSSDGNMIAIGARGNDGNGDFSGHVRVYKNQDNVWEQVGDDINGEVPGDFSENVSLSSNGNIVAIGAFGNDANGTNSGHVRIYENQGGTWLQLGIDIDGEGSFNRSGENLSLSSDGSTVAIAAFFNNGNGGNGFDSGHVRVYDISTLLSIEDIPTFSFTLYPNPSSTQVTIQLKQNEILEKTTIYNILGQPVKTTTGTIINTSELSQGLYVIEVITREGKSSQKLIVR